MWALVLGWASLMSVVTFAVAAWDKWRAGRGRRVPEATLLGLALVGGSPGLVLAMLVARHKTRKASFLARLALVLVAQAAALAWALR